MSFYNFPNQRIPESEKTENWHINHISQYLNYSGTDEFRDRKQEILEAYYSYSAELSPKKKEIIKSTITEVYGENLGPKYMVYPLCESKIEQILGEYRQRPIKRKLAVNNESAIIKKFEKKIDYLFEKEMRRLNSEIKEESGLELETENPDLEIPENIEEFFAKDYRTISEEIAEDVLNQILVVRKEKEKIYEAFRHFSICDRVWVYFKEKDGHPSIHVPHVLDIFYDTNPNENIQSDPYYFVYDTYDTINEIFNKFPEIDEEKRLKIESYSGYANSTNTGKSAWVWANKKDSNRIRVVSMIWKSFKQIKLKVFTNKNNEESYRIIKDEKEIKKNDKLKNIWVDDIRHITMIGPDVVLSYGSLNNQMFSISNPDKKYMPVLGLIGDNNIGTGKIRSIVTKLDNLQDFASEILYEVRVAMRQIDGNVLGYDLSNIPKEFQKYGENALNKVNFYLKRDRVQFYNSRDKKSNTYASSMNVSQKGRISELMNLLALIEQLADNITGIKHNPQENPYQKAAVVEMGAATSSNRMEEYFGLFDTFVETLTERLVSFSQKIYKENQLFNYFGGDMQQNFLQIFPDFFLDDIGIYVEDNRKEYQRKKRIDEVASQTFMNANSPQLIRDLIKIWNADSSTEAESILDKGLKALEELRNQAQQQLADVEKQKIEAAAKEKEEDRKIQREKMETEKEVAAIYANNKSDTENNRIQGENLRKLADIEKELMLNNNKNENKKS